MEIKNASSVMAPGAYMKINRKDQQILLKIARDSILYGCQKRKPLPVISAQYSEILQTRAATFVTLTQNNQLRGCIGTLEAYRHLVEDVACHAFAAAFQDSRFTALIHDDIPQITIEISVLSQPSVMQVEHEADLLQQLKPSEDGLILQDGPHKATFLPAVWTSLPDARDFVRHLKMKANLPWNHWSPTLKFWRYSAVKFGEDQ